MNRKDSILRSLRVVAGFALLGTVMAGAFFGGAPAIGAFSVHEVGALLGAVVGLGANAKQPV